MKKIIVFFPFLFIIIAIISCSKTKVDQPFSSKYYTITGTVTDSLGTGSASVTLNIADDGSVMPQQYGAGLNSDISWSGLSATKVDSITVKGLDQNGANISLLYNITNNNGQSGTLKLTNNTLPIAQKATMIQGTWRFIIYAKSNVLLANLNQVTTK
jgi:hypothetical protein